MQPIKDAIQGANTVELVYKTSNTTRRYTLMLADCLKQLQSVELYDDVLLTECNNQVIVTVKA